MDLGYGLIHGEYILCEFPGKNPNKVLTVSNDTCIRTGDGSFQMSLRNILYKFKWGRVCMFVGYGEKDKGGWSRIGTRRASMPLTFWRVQSMLFSRLTKIHCSYQQHGQWSHSFDSETGEMIMSVLWMGKLRIIKIKQCVSAGTQWEFSN